MPRARWKLLSLLAVVGLSAAHAGSAGSMAPEGRGLQGYRVVPAVIGGSDDGDDHPYSGTTAYQFEPGGPWYVGPGGNAVRISRTVAITAGHVLPAPPPVFGPLTPDWAVGLVFDPEPVDLSRPPDRGLGGRIVPDSKVYRVARYVMHPETFSVPGRDIGIMFLERPVRGPAAKLARAGTLDELGRRRGDDDDGDDDDGDVETLRIVGYGADEFVCCPPKGGGKRRVVDVPLWAVTADTVLGGGPSGEGAGPGDSGAGAFLGDRRVLVGVLSSFVADPVSGRRLSLFTRTDSASSCAFLSQYLRVDCRPGRDRESVARLEPARLFIRAGVGTR
jgi:hypothetical protein